MKVVLHPEAIADLTTSGDWYESQRPGLGSDFLAEVERALEVIGENPKLWPPWPGASKELNVRRLCLPRFPFALPFVVKADRVVLLAVAHERRRPRYWLGRARR